MKVKREVICDFKNVLNVFVLIAFPLFFGCSSFNSLSKGIAHQYGDNNLVNFDLKMHHPNRVKGYRDYGLKSNRDSLIFIQSFNVHNGKIHEVFISTGKLIAVESTDDLGSNRIKTIASDSSAFFPESFINAVKAWDTTGIYSIPEEKDFHSTHVFISRIVNGKIEVLRPRSYDFNK
jgi:hypothetical protein